MANSRGSMSKQPSSPEAWIAWINAQYALADLKQAMGEESDKASDGISKGRDPDSFPTKRRKRQQPKQPDQNDC